jgi:hypothetical protein
MISNLKFIKKSKNKNEKFVSVRLWRQFANEDPNNNRKQKWCHATFKCYIKAHSAVGIEVNTDHRNSASWLTAHKISIIIDKPMAYPGFKLNDDRQLVQSKEKQSR